MLVAYFSLEFGLDAGIPLYSGGLGILAGDHLKSASDLGVPLVGVGLLYRSGYFRQSLPAGKPLVTRRDASVNGGDYRQVPFLVRRLALSYVLALRKYFGLNIRRGHTTGAGLRPFIGFGAISPGELGAQPRGVLPRPADGRGCPAAVGAAAAPRDSYPGHDDCPAARRRRRRRRARRGLHQAAAGRARSWPIPHRAAGDARLPAHRWVEVFRPAGDHGFGAAGRRQRGRRIRTCRGYR